MEKNYIATSCLENNSPLEPRSVKNHIPPLPNLSKMDGHLCDVIYIYFQVVELLLDRSNVANIHEALLQAISAGHEQIAETILKHGKYRDIKRENKRFGETDYFFNTTAEDSPFSSGTE